MMTKRYIVGLVWCDECYSKVELRRHYRWLHELKSKKGTYYGLEYEFELYIINVTSADKKLNFM